MKISGIDALALLPIPREINQSEGVFRLPDQQLILLDYARPYALRFAAGAFQKRLSQVGLKWEVTAGQNVPADRIGLILQVAPEEIEHPQGYRLTIAPDGITVKAHDEAGVFYAVCTLAQIIEQAGRDLPCLQIADWPDFPARGVMLDISRDKVPKMETLLNLVDMLAGWKINQIQLYVEHTFAYQNHPQIWAEASPFTAQEIIDLDIHCRQRHIELVPNQNSFGHMHRWLEHPRYASLAEAPDGADMPWGGRSGPTSLSPIDPGSLELVCSLYEELLPNFTSRMVNVGCDETFDLGLGRSKEACEQHGTGRVYLDFLLKIYADVKRRGFTMQFWGDIIIEHPELVPKLPKDVIALEWGYEAGHLFDEHCAKFAAAGIPFYVCPGTSSWNTIAGRTDNAIGNLRNAAENGSKHGAIGYLNTDWGDNGHWQVLPVSYLGFAVGAAYSWCLGANRELDIPRALSVHAFRDSTGCTGQAACDFGNIYRSVGFEPPNSSALFWILQYPLESGSGISRDAFHRALEAARRAAALLESAQPGDPDADLIRREFENTARLLSHACRRGLLIHEKDSDLAGQLRQELTSDLLEIIPEYTQIWSERNRPGGLADSLARLERMYEDY